MNRKYVLVIAITNMEYLECIEKHFYEYLHSQGLFKLAYNSIDTKHFLRNSKIQCAIPIFIYYKE